MRTLRKCVAVLALTIVGVGTGGCGSLGLECTAFTNWFIEYVQSFLPGPDFDAYCQQVHTDLPSYPLSSTACAGHYVPIRAPQPVVVSRPKSKEFTFYAAPDSTRPNQVTTPVPFDLVPPFRVETTVGLCDPSAAPDSQAFFGASILENGGAGRWRVYCRNQGGLEVTAAFGARGARFFSNAQRVDLAFQHDGVELVAYARDPEITSTWIELDRAATGTTTGLFVTELFASNFQPGAMSSVYALKFLQNGTLPGTIGTQRQGALDVAEATAPLAGAVEDLTGLAADPVAAAGQIDSAKAEVDSAIAKLTVKAAKAKLTVEEKAVLAAVKRLKAQSKILGKASTTLRKYGLKKAKAVRKQLGAAMKQLALAYDGAMPADLRALVGGRKLSSYAK